MAREAVSVIAVCAALCLPATSTAQSDPPLTIGGGIGIANPLHGDFDFLAGTWTASLRVPLSTRVLVDTSVSQWGRTRTEVRTDVQLLGPAGPIGFVDRLTQETRHRRTSIAVSVLGTGGDGVRVTVGGGAGIYDYRRRFRQTLEGCVAPHPLTCQDAEMTFTSVRFGVQGIAEIASGRGRLRPFGQFRFDVPDIGDGGSASVSVFGGVQVVLR
jgi:hypothetical protein